MTETRSKPTYYTTTYSEVIVSYEPTPMYLNRE